MDEKQTQIFWRMVAKAESKVRAIENIGIDMSDTDHGYAGDFLLCGSLSERQWLAQVFVEAGANKGVVESLCDHSEKACNMVEEAVHKARAAQKRKWNNKPK